MKWLVSTVQKPLLEEIHCVKVDMQSKREIVDELDRNI